MPKQEGETGQDSKPSEFIIWLMKVFFIKNKL
jgi:hypothetical protein